MKRCVPYLIIIAVFVGSIGWGAWLGRTLPVKSFAVDTKPKGAPTLRSTLPAIVVIEEFGDYQCPPCAELHPILKKLQGEFGPRLQVVFRHFPLARHEHALDASRAAIAADRQGKFWAMHDWLYSNQAVWSEAGAFRPLAVGAARTLDLDVARFTQDLESPEIAATVSSDQRRAEELRVDGTPAVYVDGYWIDELTEEKLRAEIQRRLAP